MKFFLKVVAVALVFFMPGIGVAQDGFRQVCFNEAKAKKTFMDSCIGNLDYSTFTAGRSKLPAVVKVDYCSCIIDGYRIVAFADQNCGFHGRDTEDFLFRMRLLQALYKNADPECGTILLRSGFRLY